MKKLIEIVSDCLDIVKRIKSIDPDYFVVFNLEAGKFELHNSSQGKFSYCLTFPFECLDERAYLHTLKTRVQNSDEIFKEIDKQNSLLNAKKQQEIFNNFKERLYDC